MSFLSSIASFLSDPIVGTVANFATGLLGQKGANDRNEQQMAMTREQMAWQERMSNTAHQREVADLNAAGRIVVVLLLVRRLAFLNLRML